MPPYWIIDAHQDLAYNALSFGRDYLRSAAETRRLEDGTPIVRAQRAHPAGLARIPARAGGPDLRHPVHRPTRLGGGSWETQVYRDARQAATLWRGQLDYYRRLAGDHPDHFRLVTNRAELADTLAPWMAEPAELPRPAPEGQEPARRVTHPVGLVLLWKAPRRSEANPDELEDGGKPACASSGRCGLAAASAAATRSRAASPAKGYELLEVMAGLGMTLDVSHMNEKSALQALDPMKARSSPRTPMPAPCSNAAEDERHLTDLTIRRLVEREPSSAFCPSASSCARAGPRRTTAALTTFDHLVAHIDHICQIAGDARHVGLGSDFDGGWGWPHAPAELNYYC